MAAASLRHDGPEQGPWLLFGVLFAARTAIAYQFQSVASVGPQLVDGLGLTHATVGFLIGSFMLPGVVLAIPGGLLDARLGSRRTLILGLAAMVLGGLAMAGGEPGLLFAGRLVGGSGAVILNVVLATVVADRFAGRLVAVMGSFVASWPLGIALALVTLPWVADATGPAAALVVGALPAAASLLAVWWHVPETRADRTRPAPRTTISAAAAGLALTSGLVWGFYNAAYVIIVANLPAFLVERGYSVPVSATIASVLGWVLIVTLPTGGLLTGRMGRPVVAMTVCLVSIGLVAVLLVTEGSVLWWIGILSLLVGLPAGLIMALPGQALGPTERAFGMGLFFTVFYACMALLPAIAGTVRAVTAMPAAALLCGGASAVLAAACLVPFAALRRHAGGRASGPSRRSDGRGGPTRSAQS